MPLPDPVVPHPALAQAVALHKRGDLGAAEPLYRAVLADAPDNGEANHNLGVILMQRGAVRESLPILKAALAARPDLGPYWLSYAGALLAAGETAAAQALLLRGRQSGLSGPAFTALLERTARGAEKDGEDLLEKSTALASAGRVPEAIAALRQALARAPDDAEAHYRLGSLLSESGAIAQGFAHYLRRAELLYGGRPWRESASEKAHKTKHDNEQAAFLQRLGCDPSLFQLADGARVDGPAVNPANATPELSRQWREHDPQLVVIEDFLTPPALQKLRAYCAGSTIWRRVYDAGYIGAMPQDGLAAPLLAQIVQEVHATYCAIIGGHAFRYLGAFKYDSALSTGTNTHADNSAVNVNLYIAPDEANHDSESGGMDVWNVAAPPGDDMRRLNGDEAWAQDYLKRTGARLTRIPHRANRAVIFKSDLVHRTSDCRFAEGYLNKRINVSLLFGHRAASD